MIRAQTALKRLMDGNERFAADDFTPNALTTQAKRISLVGGQEPIAVILGCSDSRVPAELVFDQGLGDLFVIRVAGNIVAPSQIGSIEYACENTGTRLVVVMGHSNCGAIQATVDQLNKPEESRSPNLSSIVDRIRPSIDTLIETGVATNDPEELVKHAVRANVRASVDHLRHGSAIIESLIENDGLTVVGAEYSLETGVVEFFDHVPDA